MNQNITAKDRMASALEDALATLKKLSAEDCFTIAYVDHQLSVSYCITVEEDA